MPSEYDQLTFYEFFAGGGMARAGLGPEWRCLFANDFDEKKAAAYRENWGDGELWVGDVADVKSSQLSAHVDLAWASFPCQDLSLAGSGAGLNGKRSGAFWAFRSAISALKKARRHPNLIVVENVTGLLSSHSGDDFVELCKALMMLDYDVGAVVIDAAHFVPQSRPRLFFIAVRGDFDLPGDLKSTEPRSVWHPQSLRMAVALLPMYAQERWVWWKLPTPPKRTSSLCDIIELEPTNVGWHTPEQTGRLLSLMSAASLDRIKEAESKGALLIGAVYRRMRSNGRGGNVQRAEVRFDGLAGCLRTPTGGSSRQHLVIVKDGQVRTRLISPIEAARLMGLPTSMKEADELGQKHPYRLPRRYNEAYHLMGDGVAVPAVRFLANALIEPILKARLVLPVAAE